MVQEGTKRSRIQVDLIVEEAIDIYLKMRETDKLGV